MHLTYKYQLKLTKQQQQRIDNWIGVCRLVYNMALELKIDAHKKGIPLSSNDLQKQLPELRRDIDWIKDVPSNALVGVIQSLDTSFKTFFNRGFGFPKFKSKKKNLSFFIKSNKVAKDIRQISESEFILPKIGMLKVFSDRAVTGEICSGTIIKEINKYYLCIISEVSETPLLSNDNQVGVDVGVSNFAVLSDGTFVEHPRLLFKYQKELRKQQRKLSRCKLLGNNWYKQVMVVQKIHQKIRRSRLDFLHKVSTDIIKNNSFISVEKLNVKGMVRSNLSKHISDSGWYTFRQLLKYKSELYGRQYSEVAPNHSSQECFNCGHIDAENRQSQSIFVCVKCGHEDHADLNASKNLLRRGQRLLAQSTDNSLRLAKELVA